MGEVTNMPGRKPAVTAEEVLRHMKESSRPVWGVKELTDAFNVAKNTIRSRLEELVSRGKVEEIEFSAMTAYYLPGRVLGEQVDTEAAHRQDLFDHYTDKFVGLGTAPWTAIHPNDGPVEAGDKIQFEVFGRPGEWTEWARNHWSDRRESLEPGEVPAGETAALVSGTLYAKPTVPIEHIPYVEGYDLEKNVGGRWVPSGDSSHQILVAEGLKNYLIKPCNDAVFLKDVSVDWISTGREVPEERPVMDLGNMDEQIEKVDEWRTKNIDSDEPGL
ncbi:hypothetical protein GJR96_00660 [Haloferax sp. MBLA0076]|uniref:Uncharacterized protein n=1 Tax=Haloferax litoreum TaxID=2666140 RepID=A0A6A8GFA3_9EURY|nr:MULTISPECIES: hypothetical protein [Haloferax]KAB1192028.1 hypothetical protein Hfx1148_00660 [Haloferax sp. CBA1148]MRX20470.1 hypothetical protein [Haloferax litoreum]